jgi:hypothetical protein
VKKPLKIGTSGSHASHYFVVRSTSNSGKTAALQRTGAEGHRLPSRPDRHDIRRSPDAVVRILIAIEFVGANTPLKAKTSQFQLAAGDWKALLELIERLWRQVARELGRAVHEIEVISCYEAGYDGFWLHHLLEARGVHNPCP